MTEWRPEIFIKTIGEFVLSEKVH